LKNFRQAHSSTQTSQTFQTIYQPPFYNDDLREDTSLVTCRRMYVQLKVNGFGYTCRSIKGLELCDNCREESEDGVEERG